MYCVHMNAQPDQNLEPLEVEDADDRAERIANCADLENDMRRDREDEE